MLCCSTFLKHLNGERVLRQTKFNTSVLKFFQSAFSLHICLPNTGKMSISCAKIIFLLINWLSERKLVILINDKNNSLVLSQTNIFPQC